MVCYVHLSHCVICSLLTTLRRSLELFPLIRVFSQFFNKDRALPFTLKKITRRFLILFTITRNTEVAFIYPLILQHKTGSKGRLAHCRYICIYWIRI